MSSEKEKELNIEQLEGADVATEAKAKKEKKVLTAEDVAVLEASVEKIKAFGVSDNFAKVLPLVSVWHLDSADEALVSAKAEVIAAFGDSEKFKDYIGGEFEAELAVISGIAKSSSVLNNVKSFYKRRNPDATGKSRKKAVLIPITINNEPYTINQEFYESLSALSGAEKKEALLAHPDTKKSEAIEAL